MDAEELGGEWWLPGLQDTRVPGVLRISAVGRCELTLIGELRDPWADTTPSAPHPETGEVSVTRRGLRSNGYPRILGQVGLKEYTLEDCISIASNRNLLGGLPSETIRAHQTFRGVWFDEPEPCGDRLSVSMQWLTHWVGLTGLEELHHFKENRLQGFDLRIVDQPSRRVRLGDGYTLYLHYGFGIKGDRILERTLHQEATFEIRSTTLQPVLSMMRKAADLQALVSMGTGRTAGFTALCLNHPSLLEGPPPAPRKYRRPIAYIAEWSAQDTGDTPLAIQDLIFSLQDMGGPSALPRWLAAATKYTEPLARTMATRYSRMFVQEKLFGTVSALEAFHKIRTNAPRAQFVSCLTGCMTLAKPPFQELVADTGDWLRQIKVERNLIAHGSLGMARAEHTVHLADSAYWLFVLCMLREMEAPTKVFEAIPRSRTFQWTRAQLTLNPLTEPPEHVDPRPL